MGNLADRVKGFKLGADDYIVKPFETIVLLARIEAVLRRTHRSMNTFSLDNTVVNLESRIVSVDGKENKEAAAYRYFPSGYDGSWDYHPVTANGVG